jgi:hypothetical protein
METHSRHQAASLTDVSQYVLLLVGEACSDLLSPKALAHLAATSYQILAVLRPKLNNLRDFRAELKALCAKERFRTHVSSLAEVEMLTWEGVGLAPFEVNVLGRLLHSTPLPHLLELRLESIQVDDESFAALMQGLNKGALASLEILNLANNQIGDEGMKAFSSALSSGALASLNLLALEENQIGDTGMIAFADAIKPTDEIPMGALASLTLLDLRLNQIGDEGMQAFSAAISSGALPLLQALFVDDGALGTQHLQLKAACDARGLDLIL